MHFLLDVPKTDQIPAQTSCPVPIVLTIAGFDPSSGAGITADLKVFAAHGLYGVACATALTVQSTQGVRRSQALDPALVEETLACLSDDVSIAGVKIGVLADEGVVAAVSRWLSQFRRSFPDAPVVLDPVLRSSSGTELLAGSALARLERELLPLVSVLTPNLEEAELLSGFAAPASRASVPAMAGVLLPKLAPSGAVVITGGHLEPAGTPDEYLLMSGKENGRWIAGEWIQTRSTHGTGCAFSSALLCGLVSGLNMQDATIRAKAYVQAALAAAYPVGRGRGPMHHLFAADSIFTLHVASRAIEPSE